MSIIRCLFSHLADRAEERGYSIHHVIPCIVHIDGDYVAVDTDHIAYPAARRTPAEIEEHAKKIDEYYAQLNKESAERAKIAEAKYADWQERFRAKPVERFGAGTELKKLLAKIGINATPTCSCNKRAQIMDEKGVQWCKDNIDTIVGWLREEAEKRKLPFVDVAGKLLVRRAISLAEKAEKKRLAEQQQKPQAQDG